MPIDYSRDFDNSYTFTAKLPPPMLPTYILVTGVYVLNLERSQLVCSSSPELIMITDDLSGLFDVFPEPFVLSKRAFTLLAVILSFLSPPLFALSLFFLVL